MIQPLHVLKIAMGTLLAVGVAGYIVWFMLHRAVSSWGEHTSIPLHIMATARALTICVMVLLVGCMVAIFVIDAIKGSHHLAAFALALAPLGLLDPRVRKAARHPLQLF